MGMPGRNAFPRVYPILDTVCLDRAGVSAVDMARALVAGGARIAQYRHKGTFTRARFEEARVVGAVLREGKVLFVVNDRVDIAMALAADGVHVGQEDLPPDTVRRLAGPRMLLGYSTHSVAQLAASEVRAADYVAIGPVFPTDSKEDPDPVVGLSTVRSARSMTGKPLVAIGGVTLANAREVLAAGAAAVSMISGIGLHNIGPWMALER